MHKLGHLLDRSSNVPVVLTSPDRLHCGYFGKPKLGEWPPRSQLHPALGTGRKGTLTLRLDGDVLPAETRASMVLSLDTKTPVFSRFNPKIATAVVKGTSCIKQLFRLHVPFQGCHGKGYHNTSFIPVTR